MMTNQTILSVCLSVTLVQPDHILKFSKKRYTKNSYCHVAKSTFWSNGIIPKFQAE